VRRERGTLDRGKPMRFRADTIIRWVPRGTMLAVAGGVISWIGVVFVAFHHTTAGLAISTIGIAISIFGLVTVLLMQRSARAMFDTKEGGP
jgi:hypothetical protein